MTKLYDGEIIDLLPEKIASDTDVQCISYAIRMEMRRIMDEADRTRTMAMIDAVSEDILDVLAVELRTPCYLESMDIETKRSLVKNTLLWYMKAGTPNAVADMIQTIFGEGEIVEWFDFDDGPGQPGTFRIITNAQMTEDVLEDFLQIIQRVKNTRSHIETILIDRTINQTEYVGIGTVTEPHIAITNAPQDREVTVMADLRSKIAATESPYIHIGNSADPKEVTVQTEHLRAAAMAHAWPTVTI